MIFLLVIISGVGVSTMMLEWPGRCRYCNERITDWNDAGFQGRGWVHKQCWTDSYRTSRESGVELAPLRAPDERGRQLEWPMMFFVLLFHFGLGGVVVGWIMLTQGTNDALAGFLIAIGIILPLIGVAGIALNIVARRRIELIRQVLVNQGGWKPGR